MVNYLQMHEIIDFQVEMLVNHLRLVMYQAIDKKLFTVFLPIQEIWPLGRFFQNFRPFLSLFLPWLWVVGSGDGAG